MIFINLIISREVIVILLPSSINSSETDMIVAHQLLLDKRTNKLEKVDTLLTVVFLFSITPMNHAILDQAQAENTPILQCHETGRVRVADNE